MRLFTLEPELLPFYIHPFNFHILIFIFNHQSMAENDQILLLSARTSFFRRYFDAAMFWFSQWDDLFSVRLK